MRSECALVLFFFLFPALFFLSSFLKRRKSERLLFGFDSRSQVASTLLSSIVTPASALPIPRNSVPSPDLLPCFLLSPFFLFTKSHTCVLNCIFLVGDAGWRLHRSHSHKVLPTPSPSLPRRYTLEWLSRGKTNSIEISTTSAAANHDTRLRQSLAIGEIAHR